MSVQKKGDRWIVRRYDPNIKGGSRTVASFDSEDEARAVDASLNARSVPAARAKTVREWAAVWLRDYARPAPYTQRTYRLALKRVVHDVGNRRLDSIDRPTARRLANSWPRGTTRVARTMFGDAHRDGLTRENPFANLRLETPRGRKDLDALTEPEIKALADSAVDALGTYGSEFRAVIIFLAYVGCRPGELCCIRRDDLDVEHGEVLIRFSLDGEGGEKAPKNGKQRVVVVPPPALHALRGVPVRMDSPYLFHSARGKRLSRGTLSYAFRVVRQRWAQRDKLELYELRHACATLLVEKGLPPHVVANQLGHTDGGALVQTLYGHPRERGMRDQVKMAFESWADSGPDVRVQAANRRVS